MPWADRNKLAALKFPETIWPSFGFFPLSGGFCFTSPITERGAAKPLTPRLEWQDERRRAFVFLLRSAQTFAAAASRARGLRTSADILTKQLPNISLSSDTDWSF